MKEKSLELLLADEGFFSNADWQASFNQKTPIVRKSAVRRVIAGEAVLSSRESEKLLLKKYQAIVSAPSTDQSLTSCCLALIRAISEDVKTKKQQSIITTTHFERLMAHISIVYLTQPLSDDEAKCLKSLSAFPSLLENFLTIRLSLLGDYKSRAGYLNRFFPEKNIDFGKVVLTDQALNESLKGLLGDEFYQDKPSLIAFINSLCLDEALNEELLVSLLQGVFANHQLFDEDRNQFSDRAKSLFFRGKNALLLASAKDLYAKVAGMEISNIEFFSGLAKQKAELLKSINQFCAVLENATLLTPDYHQEMGKIKQFTATLAKFSDNVSALEESKKNDENEFNRQLEQESRQQITLLCADISSIQEFLAVQENKNAQWVNHYYENTAQCYRKIEEKYRLPDGLMEQYQRCCDAAKQDYAERKIQLVKSINGLNQLIDNADYASCLQREEIFALITKQLKPLLDPATLVAPIQVVIESMRQRIKESSATISSGLVQDFYQMVELDACLQAPSPLAAIIHSQVFDTKKKAELLKQFAQVKFYRPKAMSYFYLADKSCITHAEIPALDLFALLPDVPNPDVSNSQIGRELFHPIYHAAQFGDISLLAALLRVTPDYYQSVKNHALNILWLTAPPSEQTVKKIERLIKARGADVACMVEGKSILLHAYLAHGDHSVIRYLLGSTCLQTVPEDFVLQLIKNNDLDLAKLLLLSRWPIHHLATGTMTRLVLLAEQFDQEQKTNSAEVKKLTTRYSVGIENSSSRQKRLSLIEKKRFLTLRQQFPDAFSEADCETIFRQFDEIDSILVLQENVIAKQKEKMRSLNQIFLRKMMCKEINLSEQKKIVNECRRTLASTQQVDRAPEIDAIFNHLQSTFTAAAQKNRHALTQEHELHHKTKQILLENIRAIGEASQQACQAINQLLRLHAAIIPGIQNVNADLPFSCLAGENTVFQQISASIQMLEHRPKIKPSSNSECVEVLNSLNRFVQEKEQELIDLNNKFLSGLIYWLANYLEGSGAEDWWIFKWIVSFKIRYDLLTLLTDRFKTLENYVQTLNQPVQSLDEELNCFEKINCSLTQFGYSQPPDKESESLSLLRTYSQQRMQQLRTEKAALDQLKQLSDLKSQLDHYEASLLDFEKTKWDLEQKVKQENDNLHGVDKKLHNLEKELDATAAEKNAIYYLQQAKAENSSPIALVCADGGLADADKFHCAAYLIDHQPDVLSINDGNNNSPLHLAVGYNQPAIAQKIISTRPDLINSKNNAGITPLSIGFRMKNHAFVDAFMTQQSTPLPLDELKQDFLTAVQQGDFEAVQLFLHYKMQLLDPATLQEALHYTLMYSQEAIFKLLIREIDLNQVLFDITEYGERPNKLTPLMLAIRHEAWFAIDDLLNFSNETLQYEDQLAYNALRLAADKNQPDVVRKLVRAGAKEGSVSLVSKFKKFSDEVALWLLVAKVKLCSLRGFGDFLYQDDQGDQSALSYFSKFLYLASMNPTMRPDEKQGVIDHLTYYSIQFNPTYCDDQKNHALHYLIKAGNFAAVKVLIDTLMPLGAVTPEMKINQPNAKGDTPLHVAIRENTQVHEEIAAFLLKKGADYDVVNNEGQTACWLAAHSNNISMFDAVFKQVLAKENDKSAKKQIDEVIDAVCGNIGYTPFFSSKKQGFIARNTHMVKKLVEVEKHKNRFITTRLSQQHSLLFSVYTHVNLSPAFKTHVLEFLLKHGASLPLDECDDDGNTLLHLLVKNGNSLLFKKIMQIEGSKELLNETNHAGDTPLHLAVMGQSNDHIEIATLLVEQGANAEIYNKKGFAPVHLAVSSAMVRILATRCPINLATEKGETLESLLSAKSEKSQSDRDILTYIFNHKPAGEKRNICYQVARHELSVLEQQLALMPEHQINESFVVNVTEAEKTLFERIKNASLKEDEYCSAFFNIDLAAVDEEGMTFLGYAIFFGNKKLVSYLLDVLKVDSNQKISLPEGLPLFLAIRRGDLEMVNCLVKHRAKLDGEVERYRLLNYVAKYDKTGKILAELIKLLPQDYANAHVNIVSSNGDTPLLTAVKAKNLPIIKKLIELGADVNATDTKGNFSLLLAIQANAIEVFKYLLTCKDVGINQGNLLGDTALHVALQSETSCYFDALMNSPKAKQLVSKKNAKGESPLTASEQKWVLARCSDIPYYNIDGIEPGDFPATIKKLQRNLRYLRKGEHKSACYQIEKAAEEKDKLQRLKKRLFAAINDANSTEIIKLFQELDTEKLQIETDQTKSETSKKLLLIEHQYLITALVNSTNEKGNTVLHYLSDVCIKPVQTIKNTFKNWYAESGKIIREVEPEEDKKRQIIGFCLRHGANLQAKNHQGTAIAISTLERLCFGDTAVEMDYEGKAKMAEMTASELSFREVDTRTFAIFYQVIKNRQEGSFSQLLKNIKCGYSLERLLRCSTYETKDTLLHLILRYGTESMIVELIDKIVGTKLTELKELNVFNLIHTYNQAGQMPFHLLMRRKDAKKYINKFLALGVDPNYPTLVFGRMPLDIAKETFSYLVAQAKTKEDLDWLETEILKELSWLDKAIIKARKKQIEQIESYTLVITQSKNDSTPPINYVESKTHPRLLFCRVGNHVVVHHDDGSGNRESYEIPFNKIEKEISYFFNNKLAQQQNEERELTNQEDFPKIRALWQTVCNYHFGRDVLECIQQEQITKNKKLAVAKQLVSDAEKVETDKWGDTLLHAVAKHNDTRLMALLLKNYYVGHEINQKNHAQDTPLHIAVRLENTHMVALLLRYGADINQLDAKKFSVLDLAVQLGNETMIRLMLNYCRTDDKFAQIKFNAKSTVDRSGNNDVQKLFEHSANVEFEQFSQAVEDVYVGNNVNVSYYHSDRVAFFTKPQSTNHQETASVVNDQTPKTEPKTELVLR